MLSKVSSYIKNVGKSVAYAAVDVVKANTENTADFISTNQEVFKSAYTSIIDYRTTFQRLENTFKTSKIYRAADVGIKAVFEDLRNGTFYNKERDAAMTMEAGGSMFSMEEFEISGLDDDPEASTKLDINDGDKMVSRTISESSRLSAELISDTIVRTTKASLASQRADARLQYVQNTQLLSGVQATVGTLNNIGNTINGTNGMLKTMADNQKKFYEHTTKNITEMSAMMKEMLDMQRNIYKREQIADANAAKGTKRTSYQDIAGYSGMPDLKAYGGSVKSNLNNKLNELGLGMLLNGMGEDTNLLLSMVSSPLKFIPQMLVNSIIPQATKKASKSLDDTLGTVFSNFVATMANWRKDDGGSMSAVKKFLGDIFGVRFKEKSSVETGKFDRGPVPFDGIVRKTIVDVIPGV